MSKVDFFECYRYNEELLLVEMIVNDLSDQIDWCDFVVPENGCEKADWQCAYLEQYLNAAGTEKLCPLYEEPEAPVKPCRVAFFLYRFDEQEKALHTPYGTFSLEDPKPLPDRLRTCIEFGDED